MAAKVDTAKCNGQGECKEVCPLDAITIEGGVAVIDQDTCGDCGACVDVCPTEAITVE
jgi:NAD-dependent dihydropyrimidine dehydrogenase PreA subunit